MIFALSVLPDVDFLIPGMLHRGYTHSIIVITLLFLPFLLFRKRKIFFPYFTALTQHILADLFSTGKLLLLWPITQRFYGYQISTQLDVTFEWVLFIAYIILILYTGDLKQLSEFKLTSLLLVVPISSILLPVFLNFPIRPPTELIIPHYIFLLIFTMCPTTEIIKKLSKNSFTLRDFLNTRTK